MEKAKSQRKVYDIRRCPDCKRIVMNMYKIGEFAGLFVEVNTETVIPYKHYYDYKTNHGGYYCMDCYNKLFPDNKAI